MNDTLTLCYHAVSPTWPAPLAVTPRAFAEQLDALLERGYQPTTFTKAVRGEGPGQALVVTFDDAFRSVLDLAAPIMTSRGVPGTIFVATSYPDSGKPMAWHGLDQWMGGPHAAELACLSWDELRVLHADGWEMSSHTHTHPRLTRIDDEALAHELSESRRICGEQFGRECTTLAYPYGETDARVIAAASAAGYRQAAALDARLRVGDPLRMPRIGVYRADDPRRFSLKTARSVRAVRSSAVWNGVTVLRRAFSTQRARAGVIAGTNAEVPLAVAIDLVKLA